jgi:hypothetical protein
MLGTLRLNRLLAHALKRPCLTLPQPLRKGAKTLPPLTPAAALSSQNAVISEFEMDIFMPFK